MSLNLRGAIPALPTPFSRDGGLDLPALAGLCERAIAGGCTALVVCGTTGEVGLLTAAEQDTVIQTAVAVVAGRIPVIAGVGTSGTAATVDAACRAERGGADALLCITPYYVRPNQGGLTAHFQAVHDAVKIPLLLYDVPGRTACTLENATIARLAALPRIIGLKDATGQIERPRILRELVGRDFLLLSGDDATQAAYRMAGGDGCISVSANVAPATCAALHRAWDDSDTVAFAHLSGALAPLHAALFLDTNPIPLKRALAQLGVLENELRLPLTRLDARHTLAINGALRRIWPLEQRLAQDILRSKPPHLHVHAVSSGHSAVQP